MIQARLWYIGGTGTGKWITATWIQVSVKRFRTVCKGKSICTRVKYLKGKLNTMCSWTITLFNQTYLRRTARRLHRIDWERQDSKTEEYVITISLPMSFKPTRPTFDRPCCPQGSRLSHSATQLYMYKGAIQKTYSNGFRSEVISSLWSGELAYDRAHVFHYFL